MPLNSKLRTFVDGLGFCNVPGSTTLACNPFGLWNGLRFGALFAVDLSVKKKHAITTHKNCTVLSVASLVCNVPSRFLNAQPLWIVEWSVVGAWMSLVVGVGKHAFET